MVITAPRNAHHRVGVLAHLWTGFYTECLPPTTRKGEGSLPLEQDLVGSVPPAVCSRGRPGPLPTGLAVVGREVGQEGLGHGFLEEGLAASPHDLHEFGVPG